MIVALAVAAALGAFFFTLFIRPQDVPEPLPVSPVQHLEDRKRAIYDNLRDLQFEYRLGKLSDDDYHQTKQALQKELAGVLADLEESLKKLGLPSTMIATPPQQAPSKSAAVAGVTCAHCGAKFAQTLKFCGECGQPLHEEVRS